MDNTSLEDNTLTHTLSSACAGLVGAIFGTPADVVKARIMNQVTDERGRGVTYKNSLDCLIVTVRGEGFFGKDYTLFLFVRKSFFRIHILYPSDIVSLIFKIF